MKSIFLYSKHNFPMNLEKINACLYYDLEKDAFYRLNIMPTCTAFVSEDVEQKEVMTLTKYDPSFYMISLLWNERKVKLDNLPHYLQKRNWNRIASQESVQEKAVYNFDKQKIFNFLEKKVIQMENYMHQKNPLDRLNFIKNQEKHISSDTISLLKNQLNPEFVTQFVRERYNVNQSRKVVPQFEENQTIKPKIQSKNNKKSTSTSKPVEVPRNQSLLFSSWKKK